MPTKPEKAFRAITLYGKNTSTYKFNLSHALLGFAKKEQEIIKLQDLAKPFAEEMCSHLKTSDRQATNINSKFLNHICTFF